MSLLLGGADTTANNIAWLLYFLCKYPKVQKKVQDEVRAALGPAAMPRSFEEVEQLDYLTAVVHESMRLKTPGPALFRQCRADLNIDGYHIPKETLIILLPRHAGLQESNFAAAKEFRPERWLPGGSPGSHKLSAFFPFGTGLRICPGRSLALLESKMAIAMICQNFDVLPAVPIDEVGEHYEATMEPKNLAIYLRARARQNDVTVK